jgi:hypothetical protein
MRSTQNQLNLVDSNQPFFSHATKRMQYAAEILRGGALLCPARLAHVQKFSRFADEFTGRTQYVMFAPGFGYLVDNANMEVGFLFSTRLLDIPGTVLHLTPVVYAACLIIAGLARDQQREKWLAFFQNDPPELSIYNHPLVRTSFVEYMREYLADSTNDVRIGDSWGPSTYSEGIFQVLYLGNAELRDDIAGELLEFTKANTWTDPHLIKAYFCKNWSKLNVYRSPDAPVLDDTEKTHVQLLVPDRIPLWSSGLLGLCTRPTLLDTLRDVLKSTEPYLQIKQVGDIPVYCGSRVYGVQELIA